MSTQELLNPLRRAQSSVANEQQVPLPLAAAGTVLERRTWPQLSVAAAYVGLYALLPHKEVSFHSARTSLLKHRLAHAMAAAGAVLERRTWPLLSVAAAYVGLYSCSAAHIISMCNGSCRFRLVLERRTSPLLSVAGTYVGLYSLLPHKEVSP